MKNTKYARLTKEERIAIVYYADREKKIYGKVDAKELARKYNCTIPTIRNTIKKYNINL